ncbi:MAG: PD40 domain-containing protein [Acidobacteria bacterium]|nr:PD40 domain-containing protein [Acidobacteriota bacterium]
MKRLFGVFVISFLLDGGCRRAKLHDPAVFEHPVGIVADDRTDGKRLFYLTNVSGNIAGLDDRSAEWNAETGYELRRQRWVRALLAERRRACFRQERGGDENTQFFLMDANGANIRELTASPKIRHNFGGWSDDGSKIYYASNKRNPQYFDIYAMTVADGKEEIVYQFDGSNSFAGASSDGRRVIVSRSGTELSLDNNLYLYDTQLKTETLLTPHTDASQFGDVEILPDGDSPLFTSNKDREFAAMVQMDNVWLKGNPMPFLIRPEENWDVEGVTFPENGSHFAYTLNREGFSELRLRKYEVDGKPLITRILARRDHGQASGARHRRRSEFSGDGSSLFYVQFFEAQFGRLAHDLESKSLTQITKSDRAGIDADSFATPELIGFKTFDGREIPAWYYKPRTN